MLIKRLCRTLKYAIASVVLSFTASHAMAGMSVIPLPEATVGQNYSADLLAAAKSSTKAEGFAAEDKALADLVAGDQFRASIYAFNLVQKRAKKPAGAPEKELAKKVTKVGVLGAGLMASQFALQIVRKAAL